MAVDAALTNGGEAEGSFLYDPSLLEGLDDLKGPPCATLRVRPLSADDYDRGFLGLLSQLTVGGDVSREEFLARFQAMRSRPDTYYVTVVEDTERGAVVGTATLVAELKFIRNLATRGHLEDVVVSSDYRGRQLGKLIVQTMVHLARKVGCYKLTLDCKDPLTKFYADNGFTLEPGNANSMSLRFSDDSDAPH
uniref:Glucosamine 6-phosphate N-acetyltransferase n=1 Tax=Ixodes ricinus TaxID=34613 RepID=V5HK81_IXORI